MSRSGNNGRQLTRAQKRVLLWMPLLGFWAVLLLVGGNEESGRDWANIAIMGIVGGLVYVGLWFALIRITSKPDRPAVDSTDQPPASRASLIYGPQAKRPAEGAPSPGAPAEDDTQPPTQS